MYFVSLIFLTVSEIVLAFFCLVKKTQSGIGRYPSNFNDLIPAFGICREKSLPIEYSAPKRKSLSVFHWQDVFPSPKFCRKTFRVNDSFFHVDPARKRGFPARSPYSSFESIHYDDWASPWRWQSFLVIIAAKACFARMTCILSPSLEFSRNPRRAALSYCGWTGNP